MIWQCGRYSFDSRTPVIMGILNVTPDSFSDGGRFSEFSGDGTSVPLTSVSLSMAAQSGTGVPSPRHTFTVSVDAALAAARQMVDEGALIIDVGGESTRPGAAEVSLEEELARTVDVVRALAAEKICVSVDTRHAEVARACVEAGASIINDVTGFSDPAMVDVAASCDAGLVVMHWAVGSAVLPNGGQAAVAASADTRSAFVSGSSPHGGDGTPVPLCAATLNEADVSGTGVPSPQPPPSPGHPLHPVVSDETAFQGDIVAEVADYLRNQADMLQAAGVARSRIALDPGPGFSKTNKQSLELMRNFHEFVRLGYPTVSAPSRKRYVGEAYGIENPTDRDEASATEALMTCELGASVVRMHNVSATVAALENLRPYVLLALGANVALVGDPGQDREALVAQINQAISALSMLPDSQLIDVSSFYESEPAYVEDQAKFVNAVVLLRSAIAPRDLLQYIHAIEDSLGRVRTIANGPRTCDIDILDYQLYISDGEELTLPHPRILERDFVVKPLLEILPHHVLADGTPVTTDHVTLGWATKL